MKVDWFAQRATQSTLIFSLLTLDYRQISRGGTRTARSAQRVAADRLPAESDESTRRRPGDDEGWSKLTYMRLSAK